MERKSGSYQMRDYAETDPRSFKAALQGRDDGRWEAYNRYCRKALERDPTITDEVLAEQYVAYVRLREQKRAWREQSLNPLFHGYSRAFLSAVRACADRENALDQAARRHPGEIFNWGFDATLKHLAGGILMFFVMYEILQALS
jgi:hypothetical protein